MKCKQNQKNFFNGTVDEVYKIKVNNGKNFLHLHTMTKKKMEAVQVF